MIQCMYTSRHNFKRGDLINVKGKANFVVKVLDNYVFEYRPVKWYDFALVAWWKLSDWYERSEK